MGPLSVCNGPCGGGGGGGGCGGMALTLGPTGPTQLLWDSVAYWQLSL